MTLLVLGVLLFAGLHLIKSLAPDFRAAVVGKLGTNPYRGLFSLLVLGAVALIVLGWRGSTPVYVYTPLHALQHPAMTVIFLAFLFMVAGSRPSRLRRLVRHPQLTGVVLWGGAHLVLNGDSRALVLFGGLVLWALLEMLAINRRDGVWIKEEAPGWGSDLLNLLITLVVVAVVIYLHPWLAGVSITGRLPQ